MDSIWQKMFGNLIAIRISVDGKPTNDDLVPQKDFYLSDPHELQITPRNRT